MGFYSRKSMNFGELKVNFSKSGIGFSTGIKGFRVGTGPKGNYVYIGKGGYRYRKTLSKKESEKEIYNSNTEKVENEYNFKDIQNIDILKLSDSSHDELVREIKCKREKLSITLLMSVIFVIAATLNHYFLFSFLLVPFLLEIDNKRRTVILVYDIDENSEGKIQNFYDSFKPIIFSEKKWEVQSEAKLDKLNHRKINAGANQLVKRYEVIAELRVPKNFKTNVEVPFLKLNKKDLYFFPDKLLIFEGKKVACIDYKNIQVYHENTTFIEECVYRDTRKIGETWKYVNKNGNPDKRYKDNSLMNIVEYSQILFESNRGLNLLISLSKPDIGKAIELAIKGMI